MLEDYSLPSRIVAKIETRAGVDNVEAIARCADAVMIARGDLAVQLAVERADTLEVEDMIRGVCRQAGTHCIVATRVAESLELGGEGLTRRELARLAHELFIGPPLTLMLAQETSVGGGGAEKNYDIVLEALSGLLPSYQRQWARL
jgi:pyruvate kinase